MRVEDISLRDICTAPVDNIEQNKEDYVLFLKHGTTLNKVEYDELAKAIIEEYTLSTLAGEKQSVQRAINQIAENPTVTTNIVNFETAADREELNSGDTVGTLFGKIKKWLLDLKEAAFCGVKNALNTTDAGYVLDARAGKTLNDKITANITAITNNKNSLKQGAYRDVTNALTQTEGGKTVLDAYQGKVLNDKIAANAANISANNTKIAENTTSITNAHNNLAALMSYIDYAQISFSDDVERRIKNNTITKVAGKPSVAIGHGTTSVYFTATSTGVKFKKSGQYLMIIEGYWSRNQPNSSDYSANITFRRTDTQEQMGVGATGFNNGGTDISSTGIITVSNANLNIEFALYASHSSDANSAGGRLTAARVLFLPMFI